MAVWCGEMMNDLSDGFRGVRPALITSFPRLFLAIHFALGRARFLKCAMPFISRFSQPEAVFRGKFPAFPLALPILRCLFFRRVPVRCEVASVSRLAADRREAAFSRFISASLQRRLISRGRQSRWNFVRGVLLRTSIFRIYVHHAATQGIGTLHVDAPEKIRDSLFPR